MDPQTLNSICTLLMCDDPTQLEESARKNLEAKADAWASSFGFPTWVDFYNQCSLAGITARNGLLYRNDKAIGLPLADSIAKANGFQYAEQLVAFLKQK